MEILNQTNKYIEELGEKVNVQKEHIGSIRKAGRKMKDSEDSNDEMEEQ